MKSTLYFLVNYSLSILLEVLLESPTVFLLRFLNAVKRTRIKEEKLNHQDDETRQRLDAESEKLELGLQEQTRTLGYDAIEIENEITKLEFESEILEREYEEFRVRNEPLSGCGPEVGIGPLHESHLDNAIDHHGRRIQMQYGQLLNNITCIYDIVADVFQHGNLTVMEMEDLTHCPPLTACDKLLKLIMTKSNEVYQCFLEAVVKTEQPHIYQLLTYTGIEIDQNHISEHFRAIRQHFTSLIDNITPEPLLGHLFQMKVLTSRECEDVSSRKGTSKTNEALLLIITRKSPEHFAKFKEALNSTNQEHVVEILEGIVKDNVDKNNKTRLLEISEKTLHRSNSKPSQESSGRTDNAVVDRDSVRPTTTNKKRSILTLSVQLKKLEEKLQIHVSLKVAALDERNDIRCIILKKILQESYILKRNMKDIEMNASKMVMTNQALRKNIVKMKLELSKETSLKVEANCEKYKLLEHIKTLEHGLREAESEITELKLKNEVVESENKDPVAEIVPANELHHKHKRRKTLLFEMDDDPSSVNKRGILDLAIFNGGLCAARRVSAVIEVYDSDTFIFTRRWKVANLNNIQRLEASKDGKYLVVLSFRYSEFIIHVADASLNIISRWKKSDILWESFDLTSESTLLLFNSGMIIEYSLEGNIAAQLDLPVDQLSDLFGNVTQCVKLSRNRFVLRLGDYYRNVRMLDLDLPLIKELRSLEVPKSSMMGKMYVSSHIAVNENGWTFIIDKCQRRILVCDQDLRYRQEILLDTEDIGNPRKLVTDNSGSKLFVIHSTGILMFEWSSVNQGFVVSCKLGLDFKPIVYS